MELHAHILIVEDHPIYRDALARMLSAPIGAARCSAASTEDDALALLNQHSDIDLVIADQVLMRGNGLSLLDKVGKRWPTVARVLLSGSHDASLPGQARNLGLMAFLPKTLEPVEIAGVIGQVLAGEVWYPAEDGEPDTPRLTPRQASVLQAVASGQANKHIARSLGVSESTVKFHLEEAFARLAVSSRAEAVARALQLGLISLIR